VQFSEDPQLQTVAEAYALDAVDFALSDMKITLDWTDQSVRTLESILDVFNRSLTEAKPSEEQIYGFSKMWGSYLGEVYRKNHGATWGRISHKGDWFPGLRATSGSLFWPWGRVQNRIRNGPEDNVWHYYQELTGRPRASDPIGRFLAWARRHMSFTR
jgi:hypothetical protein